MLRGDHGVADVLLEPRREAGRGHLADALAVSVDPKEVDHRAVVVGTQRLTPDLDADELALGALLLDPRERLLADEVRALLEVDHPVVAPPHLVRVRVVPHVRPQSARAALAPARPARPDRRPGRHL